MAHRFGNNRNTNDSAPQTTIVLNSTTATKIADVNLDRMAFIVNIDGLMGNNSIFIKTQAAAIDDIKQGPWIGKQGIIFEVSWPMPTGAIYTGEISAIADSGTPTVFVTEW